MAANPKYTEAVEQYFQTRGMTTEQAVQNLMKRFPFYTREKAEEEAQVGYLCESILEGLKKIARTDRRAFDQILDDASARISARLI